ncbi:hypothetical protein BBP40_009132 [Aspergillus hancockii]|nr:hypothetical protein BBP40_009132 [Aspergillus hancockii]
METSSDPTPTSLLWAHEIRRENIHLVDQIHTAKSDLSTTIATVNVLKQDLGEFSQQLKQADTEIIQRLKDIESRVEGTLATLLGRIEVLEVENGKMKNVLENVGVRTNELSQVVVSMKTDVMGEVRGMLAKERDTLRFREKACGNGDIEDIQAGSDVLVPDSMPKDDISSTQCRRDSLRALSETTWGPSSLLEEQHDDQRGRIIRRRIGESDSHLDQSTKQDGRPHGDHLSHADKIHNQLPSWDKSSNFVKAFVGGLENPIIRGPIERQLDIAGWSRNALADIMINEDISQAGGLCRRMKADSGGVRLTLENNNPSRRRRKKKRRVIPIVPADEEELLNMRVL